MDHKLNCGTQIKCATGQLLSGIKKEYRDAQQAGFIK